MPFAMNDMEPMDTTEVPDPTPKKPKRRSTKSRTVIRQLVAPGKDRVDSAKLLRHNSGRRVPWKNLLLLMIGAAGSFMLVKHFNHLRQEFAYHYHQAFERLSRETSSLCQETTVDINPLLAEVDRRVVGQRHLHESLGRWLRNANNAPFSSAVFMGGTGVGKSMTASIIAHHFPWPANVHYVPDIEHGAGNKRYGAFKTALFKIQRTTSLHGRCTHYLVVVDHLGEADVKLVRRISDRLRSTSTKQYIFVHALFVFQGSAVGLQVDEVRETIPDAQVIHFNDLDRNGLEECIRRETSKGRLNQVKNETLVQLVADQINPAQYGCKPVRAKLNLYYSDLHSRI